MKRTISFLLFLAILLTPLGCKKGPPDGGGLGDVRGFGAIPAVTAVAEVDVVEETDQREKGTYDGPAGTWAIYWYLCGTDLESRAGFATDDLNEMIQVTLPENVTVVIQTGGTETWQNGIISSDTTERYTYTGSVMTLVDSQPLANMGSPQTLADFLDYCNTNYPAEKQGLILWDHGGGSIHGLGLDEVFDGDMLSLAELKTAIDAVPAVSGMYEFVGIDACLMATIDVVGILEGSARYMIASEEIEPGIGWEYAGLFSALAEDTSMSGGELGKAICDSYYKGCAAYGLEEKITLSVIDMSKAGALLDAYEAMGYEALVGAAEGKESYFSAFGRAAYESESFADGEFDMVDLGDLTRNAAALFPNRGQTLLRTLDESVIYQVRGDYRQRASGLSCFFLFSGDVGSYNTFITLETSKSFAFFYEYSVTGELSELARKYINDNSALAGQQAIQEQISLTPTRDMGLSGHPVFVGSDGRWHLDLGPDKASNLAAVFVNLMWVEPVSGLQVMWGTNQDLTMDWEKGEFVEDFRDDWGCIDYAQVFMQPVDYDNGRVLYAVPILLNGEPHTLGVGYYNGEYEILSAVKKSETSLASKTQRKLKPGDVVEPIQYLVPLHDDGSRTIEDMPMGMVTVDENTTFYTRSLGNGYFRIVFEMIDYAGKTYNSGECAIRVRNGVIERLPGGIVPAAQRPDYANEVHFIGVETWFHEAWNEEIEYYTAVVDAETYSNFANIIGTDPYGDSMTDTYTIQLISDTIDLQEYVDVRMAWITGAIHAAGSAFEQRDIVFEVDSVTIAW